MSDQQKIWFLYLTDHHEGPFTPQEVAEKFAEGLVNGQSLSWKDGMAEWLPLESVPELSAALAPPVAAAAIPSAPSLPEGPPSAAPPADDGFSLAQLLAQQQQSGETAGAGLGNASPAAAAMTMTIDPGSGAGEPGPDDEVWTLRVGNQVSGLHSLQRLKALAADGEVPPDALIWHPGWADFQPISVVPDLAHARRARPATGGLPAGLGAPVGGAPAGARAGGGRPKGLSPLVASASVGREEPTDPAIEAPRMGVKSKAANFFARLGQLFRRKKSASVALGATGAMGAGKAPLKRTIGKAGGGAFKRVAGVMAALVLVAGAAAGYFLFLASPLPSDLDVIADDLEAMKLIVKEPAGAGPKFFLALARGTEDNPADDTGPKFYVATNAPENAEITLTVTGQPGTLVNRISFEKVFSAVVGKNHLAIFERVNDDGKPLPMGEYSLKVSAAAGGSEPLVANRFLGGRKGGAYEDRLKKYKDKLQGDYDKEMQELREYIDTLKSLEGEMVRHLAEWKAVSPATKAKVVAEGKSFLARSLVLTGQLDQKLKGRAANAATAGQTFHPRAFQDVATALAQAQQWLQMHGQRLDGATVSTEEVEAALHTSVTSLEQWLAQALVKNPFELLRAAPAAPEAAR